MNFILKFQSAPKRKVPLSLKIKKGKGVFKKWETKNRTANQRERGQTRELHRRDERRLLRFCGLFKIYFAQKMLIFLPCVLPCAGPACVFDGTWPAPKTLYFCFNNSPKELSLAFKSFERTVESSKDEAQLETCHFPTLVLKACDTSLTTRIAPLERVPKAHNCSGNFERTAERETKPL